MQNSHINSNFFNRKWTDRGVRALQFVHILVYKACFISRAIQKIHSKRKKTIAK